MPVVNYFILLLFAFSFFISIQDMKDLKVNFILIIFHLGILSYIFYDKFGGVFFILPLLIITSLLIFNDFVDYMYVFLTIFTILWLKFNDFKISLNILLIFIVHFITILLINKKIYKRDELIPFLSICCPIFSFLLV